MLIDEAGQGRMDYLGFTGRDRGQAINAFGNEVVKGKSRLQREIRGLINSIGGPLEQGFGEGCLPKEIPAIGHSLDIVFVLPFDEPAGIKLGKQRSDLVGGEEALGSKLLVKGDVIHF